MDRSEWVDSYVIVRTESAGVFAGILKDLRVEGVAELADARRIWLWAGAASLSELAVRGTCKPEMCKFPAPVQAVHLFQVIEVLAVSEEAERSIRGVPEWTAA